MNDRFGISLKNDESNFNPLNDPAHNVYGNNKLLYSEILTKNKRKFPMLYGNNINNPDYLKNEYCKNNMLHEHHLPKHAERRRYFPEPDYSSAERVHRGKKTILELNNRESKDTLNDFTYPKVSPFVKKLNSGYNVINHRVSTNTTESPVQSKYLSKLGEFTMSIKQKEKNYILSKLNNNHRLNDGIYDYLKEHKYI